MRDKVSCLIELKKVVLSKIIIFSFDSLLEENISWPSELKFSLMKFFTNKSWIWLLNPFASGVMGSWLLNLWQEMWKCWTVTKYVVVVYLYHILTNFRQQCLVFSSFSFLFQFSSYIFFLSYVSFTVRILYRFHFYPCMAMSRCNFFILNPNEKYSKLLWKFSENNFYH